MENKRFFTATDVLEKFMEWIGEKVRDVGRGR